MCAKGKAQDKKWMSVVFGPSGNTALETTGHHCICSGTLLEIPFGEETSPCNQQMQFKIVLCKEQVTCEHDPETLSSFLGQS